MPSYPIDNPDPSIYDVPTMQEAERLTEPMTLIERLRNPQWVSGPDFNAPPQLDVEQTRDDMNEAADEIDRLQDAKRRALAIADERSRENVELREELERVRKSRDEWCAEYVKARVGEIESPN